MHWMDAVIASDQGIALRTEVVFKGEIRTFIIDRHGIAKTHSIKDPYIEVKAMPSHYIGFLDWIPAECLGEETMARIDDQYFSIIVEEKTANVLRRGKAQIRSYDEIHKITKSQEEIIRRREFLDNWLI